MFSQLAEKASFVNYLPLLTQATSDDGEPTSGYLLDEITNISFQSMSSSQQLVEYLIHRLNKSPTHVKIKVLKIIINLINNGHPSLRHLLRQNDGAIKSTLLHSGPADPLLGYTLYKDAQKLAQDALDLLFNPDKIIEDEADVQGFASVESPAVFMGGMGATARPNSKFEGFGNALKEREGTVADKMLDYLGRLIHPSDEETSEVIRAALHSSPGDYQPVPVAGSFIEPVYAAESPVTKTQFVKSHIPGRAGGGWESDDDEHTEDLQTQSIHDLTAKGFSFDCSADPSIIILKEQSDDSKDDIICLQAQEVLSKFCNMPGLPTIDELDEACARVGVIGCLQAVHAMPKVYSELKRCLSNNSILRLLMLLEWLYFHDTSMLNVFAQNASEMLEMAMRDLELPEVCRSKARKLKILQEKSQTFADSITI